MNEFLYERTTIDHFPGAESTIPAFEKYVKVRDEMIRLVSKYEHDKSEENFLPIVTFEAEYLKAQREYYHELSKSSRLMAESV